MLEYTGDLTPDDTPEEDLPRLGDYLTIEDTVKVACENFEVDGIDENGLKIFMSPTQLIETDEIMDAYFSPEMVAEVRDVYGVAIRAQENHETPAEYLSHKIDLPGFEFDD